MLEKFAQEKIKSEKEIVESLPDLSRESIIKSNLSEFSKNYLLNGIDKQIEKDELFLKLEKSVKLNFNYTIRPGWTLLTYLFGNYESRPPGEISNKLLVFPFYKFYTDPINEVVQDDFQIFITKSETAKIIDETNKAIFNKLTDNISNLKIKNFFLQVFKLRYEEEFNYNLESTVPYLFIRIFLQDKSYTDLEKKFSVINNLSEQTEISLKDIIKVFTNKYKVPDFDNAAESDQVLKVSESEKIIVDFPGEVKEVQAEIKPKELYSKELIQANEEKGIADIEDKPVALNNDEIKNLFNDRHLQKILDKVYHSDLIYREKSLEKLNNFHTWEQATDHLKEIFRINRVDIYDKDIVSYVDRLNEYFINKG